MASWAPRFLRSLAGTSGRTLASTCKLSTLSCGQPTSRLLSSSTRVSAAVAERQNELPHSAIELQQPLSTPPPDKPSTPTSAATHRQSGRSDRRNPSKRYDSRRALALLRSQPSHYIVASLYMRRYLLTPRDILTVPRLKDVSVGDIVSLDRIHELGSRDYTIRASEGETLGQDIIAAKATVIEHTKGVMQATVKFKKRKGYTKTIKTKPMYTRLRINDFVLGTGRPRTSTP